MPRPPRQLLDQYGLRAKKGLGQNFLLPGTGERIVRAARITADDWAVEIGPGLGALTEALLDVAARVIAIEIDPDMVRVLEGEYGDRPNLEIVQADARDFDLAAYHERAGRKLRLLGNLPYYLSSPLVRRAVEQRAHVVDAHFTLQKEVADRIAAPPGGREYGSLSVITGVWADASVALKLSPGAFHPRPGVDSALLRLVFRETPRVPVDDPALFERVVFAAFGQRRKTIQNSLRRSDLPLDPPAIAGALAEAGVDPGRRAETLSVEEFGALYEAVRRAL